MGTANSLATTYLEGKAETPTQTELNLFRQWLGAELASIPAPIWYTAEEVSPKALLRTYAETGALLISAAYNVHPFWTPQENLRFRAVHDWHHISTGAGFDLEGELQAADRAISTAPAAIHWILFSEVALQAATAIHTGSFAKQKLVRC